MDSGEMRRGAYILCTLTFFTIAVLCEFLPLAFGTGHAARVDWALSYVTLRFVVLPASAVGLAIWGATALVSRVRHGRDALRLVPLLLVPLLCSFTVTSVMFPGGSDEAEHVGRFR